MKSPIIWFGGKSNLAPEIIRHMPSHKCYVEPFGGGANVLVQKAPVPFEIYNDIDEELVNFLMVLREDTERLAIALDTLPYSRSLYERWKWEEPPKDRFQRAVRWFYLNRSAISAGNNHRSGWRHGKHVNPAADYHSAVGKLMAFADRVRNVQIECRQAFDVIEAYDGPDTLHYIDPPYVGRERRYKGGWRREDHVRLADQLEAVKGKVILSYYPDELIDHLYDGWQRVEIQTTSSCRTDGERPERTELLLMNWNEDPQMNIFDLLIESVNAREGNPA